MGMRRVVILFALVACSVSNVLGKTNGINTIRGALGQQSRRMAPGDDTEPERLFDFNLVPTEAPTRVPKTPKPTTPPTEPPPTEQEPPPTAQPTAVSSQPPPPPPTAQPTTVSSPQPEPPTAQPTSVSSPQPEPPTSQPTAASLVPPPPTSGQPTTPPTASPTTAPLTESPTAPPTKAPTESPTKAPTQSPTVAPTKAPTAAPTVSPTAAPTVSPTKAPTETPTASPTSAPTPNVETATAKGMLMVLDNATPMDSTEEQEWIGLTQEHLAKEVINTLGYPMVDVTVTLVSGVPAGRALQAGLELIFNVAYAIETPMEVIADAEALTIRAFNSDYKRSLYLDSLVATGSAAFQNANGVTVSAGDGSDLGTDPPTDEDKDASGANTSPDGGSWFDTIDTGIIIGVALAGVVVIVVGIAIFARFRKRRASKPIEYAMQESDQSKDLDNSPIFEAKASAMLERSSSKTDEMEAEESETSKTSAQEETMSDSYRKYVDPTANKGSLYSSHQGDSAYESDIESTASFSFRGLFNYTTKEQEPAESEASGPTKDSEFTVEVDAESKLGMLLNTDTSGYPTVKELKPISPFLREVQVGDKLHKVDGDDLQNATRQDLLRALAVKDTTGSVRKFVFARAVPDDKKKKKWWH